MEATHEIGKYTKQAEKTRDYSVAIINSTWGVLLVKNNETGIFELPSMNVTQESSFDDSIKKLVTNYPLNLEFIKCVKIGNIAEDNHKKYHVYAVQAKGKTEKYGKAIFPTGGLYEEISFTTNNYSDLTKTIMNTFFDSPINEFKLLKYPPSPVNFKITYDGGVHIFK